MTGISNVDGFQKIINQNRDYQKEVTDLVSNISRNYVFISNNIEGKYFDFLRDDSDLQEKGIRDIRDVVGSYSDSLTNVKHGYISQDQNLAMNGLLK